MYLVSFFLGFFRKATWLHIGLVSKFFFFNVFLLTMDIVTDINTGLEYHIKGDSYWGVCTILLISAPFAARTLIFLFDLRKCVFLEFHPYNSKNVIPRLRKNTARIEVLWYEWMKLLCHFPLLHPLS